MNSTAMTPTQPGGLPAPAMTVLGERQVRIPTGGKIRSGIKVLTATAKQHQKAQAIYDHLAGEGKTWDEIERALRNECGFDRSPLTPKNVPYFTVRRADFAIPESADALMDTYAEDRDEGYHLYRFPVVFFADAWQTVLPHSLSCYTASELKYWSEYGPDGKRYCKMRGAVAMVGDGKNRRAARPFGGRPSVLRPENDGLCVPDNCPEYQGRKCTMRGSLLFYVPGIPGSSALELTTTSFYSLQQMRAKLEMVAFIRGRLAGTDGGKPIFWLTKKRTEVSMIDPDTGKAKRVQQWLVEIEADIDMTRLFCAAEAPALGVDQAARAIEGPTPDGPNGVAVASAAVDSGGEAPPIMVEATAGAEDPKKEAIRNLRTQVFDAMNLLGITAQQLGAYGTAKWGAQWSTTQEPLTQALAVLNRAADDDELLKSIKAEAWINGPQEIVEVEDAHRPHK